MENLYKIPEPKLIFNYSQKLEDPRDGLTLFGPLDKGKPYGIRYGVIGTNDGVKRFKNWVQKIQKPIFNNDEYELARPMFPGFEAAFRIPWDIKPSLEILVSNEEIDTTLYLDDRHNRVYKTVSIYSDRIINAIAQEDTKVDIWFVIIPDRVYQYCRPNSYVDPDIRVESTSKLPLNYVHKLRQQKSLFPEDNQKAIPYFYDVNFHHQLKARILKFNIATQIIRESTIAYQDFKDSFGRYERDLSKMESAIAWNISTSTFYKAGGRPWKISDVRDGVCYVGLVFKKNNYDRDPSSACCGAQMFLDSGDGVVFKGAVGPWYQPERGDFHLSYDAAKELISLVLESYEYHTGNHPKELFIHGKVRFNKHEWAGFNSVTTKGTNLVGVRIRHDSNLKLYRSGSHPILRGLSYIRDSRTAYLWTKGFVPRLQTYPGREVPNPLLIDVCRGEADINTVLKDIMGLTKLNYNTCIFADGLPVTLRFADAIGEILTAGPLEDISPLPFRNYI